MREELRLEWTYNSNSIEGNTLTLAETRVVLEDGITIGGKTLREHFEVINHHEAIGFIETTAKQFETFSVKTISDVHFYVLKLINTDYAGRFRNVGVRIAGANFTPPNALKVPGLIDEFIFQFSESEKNMHPIVAATWFHHRFVWIHPFADGNGRTVRLLFNLYLMTKGYPPAIILKADRNRYYASLNEANKGNYDKLLLLMCQAMERTLDIYLSNLENYADEYKPTSDIAEEPEVPYGQEYLSLLARRGEIDAYKEGTVWFTTVKAVKQYRTTRKRHR